MYSSDEALPQQHNYLAVIKVVGVGGAGGNAINRMVRSGLKAVEFIAINTDIQALMATEGDTKLSIGHEITQGLGAGADSELGEKAAEENRTEIVEALKGADMIFVAAGEGGGTGTGAAPIVAEIARELGSLTIAVVTRPFDFEGSRRASQAEKGIRKLQDKVDALIVIPNNRLLETTGPDTPLEIAFGMSDDVLLQAIQGVTDLITRPGLINIDFADVKTILRDAGTAIMGVGEANGEERAVSAARKAISSPLLENSMQAARGIILNIASRKSSDIGIHEVNESAQIIRAATHEDSNIIFGTSTDDSLEDKIRITVIAAGFIGKSMRDGGSTPRDFASEGEDASQILEEINSGEFEIENDEFDVPDFLK